MDVSGIKVTVEVDTDDLDIAIGKAKELNRELKKAKVMMNELADEAEQKERIDDAICCIMEALRRDVGVGCNR